MKNKLARIQEDMISQIQDFYEDIKQLLLSPTSYTKTVIELEHVHLFFSFTESALQRPLNRVAHIDSYLRDHDGLMVNEMEPFAHLSPSASEQIHQVAQKAITLAECHTLLYPDAERGLSAEPHEEESRPAEPASSPSPSPFTKP